MKTNQLPHERAIRLIWDIEKKFDVSSLKFHDIHIWPILRISIYNENLWAINSGRTTLIQKINKLSALLTILFENQLDYKNNSRPKPADIYFSSSTTSRRTLVNGKWHDFIFSPLTAWTKKINPNLSIYFEEVSPDGQYRKPRHEPTEYITSNLVKAYITGLVFPERKCTELDKSILEIKQFIDTEGCISSFLDSKNIYKRLSQFKRCVSYYEKKLAIIKPRIIFINNYYSLFGMALIHIAKLQKIKTIDMQHGLQGKMHVAYGSWKSIPNNGYSCLPDLFWTWSRINTLQAGENHIIFAGGNIQTEYWKNKKNITVNSILESARSMNRDTILLVSLQPKSDYLLDEIISVIQHKLLQKCYWLIRLHPSMDDTMVKSAELKLSPYLKYCNIKKSSKLPLPLLLDISSGHITVSSSVTIEAAEKGISTMLYYENNKLYNNLSIDDFILLKKKNESFFKLTVRYLQFITINNNLKKQQHIEPYESLKKLLTQSLDSPL